MTEFEFYDEVDPGGKRKKTRCELRDMFLNQAQENSKIRLENNRHISEWLQTEL